MTQWTTRQLPGDDYAAVYDGGRMVTLVTLGKTTSEKHIIDGEEVSVVRRHDSPEARRDLALILAAPDMAELLREATMFSADAFDAEQPEDVEGADLVDWFAEWRLRVKHALAGVP